MNGYMMCPLDLTERQLLIYFHLYQKCNFNTMKVSYTSTQLANDIVITDLSRQTIDKEIKKLIKKGYLKLLEKGSKGNPSIYIIEKMRALNEHYNSINVALKPTNSNGSSNDKEHYNSINEALKEQPIKEKEKENINNIVSKLNKLASTKFRTTTPKTVSLIKARLKEGYTVEDFYNVIECKTSEWTNTEFEKFLNPTTLFGNKFEGYLNQANKKALAGTRAKENTYRNSICSDRVEYSSFGEFL